MANTLPQVTGLTVHKMIAKWENRREFTGYNLIVTRVSDNTEIENRKVEKRGGIFTKISLYDLLWDADVEDGTEYSLQVMGCNAAGDVSTTPEVKTFVYRVGFANRHFWKILIGIILIGALVVTLTSFKPWNWKMFHRTITALPNLDSGDSAATKGAELSIAEQTAARIVADATVSGKIKAAVREELDDRLQNIPTKDAVAKLVGARADRDPVVINPTESELGKKMLRPPGATRTKPAVAVEVPEHDFEEIFGPDTLGVNRRVLRAGEVGLFHIRAGFSVQVEYWSAKTNIYAIENRGSLDSPEWHPASDGAMVEAYIVKNKKKSGDLTITFTITPTPTK